MTALRRESVAWALALTDNAPGFPAQIPEIPAMDRLSPLMTVVIVSSMIGYMESIAVGLTYAGKARNPNPYTVESCTGC